MLSLLTFLRAPRKGEAPSAGLRAHYFLLSLPRTSNTGGHHDASFDALHLLSLLRASTTGGHHDASLDALNLLSLLRASTMRGHHNASLALRASPLSMPLAQPAASDCVDG